MHIQTSIKMTVEFICASWGVEEGKCRECHLAVTLNEWGNTVKFILSLTGRLINCQGR